MISRLVYNKECVMALTANEWRSGALAVIIGVLAWIEFILVLNPRKPFTKCLGRRQWIGLGFSIALPVLAWWKLVLLRGKD